MRIVFVGLSEILSYRPLQMILKAGCDVRAVIVPAADPAQEEMRPLPAPDPASSRSELPLATSYVRRDVVHLAWERGIAAFEVGDLRTDSVQATFDELAPDLVCVSCFTRRIPASLLAQPRHGFLNLHPSLLPAYRGPHPLFWQFREGVTETGVTLHFMDEGLDTGDVALQAPLTLPEGISGPEAERRAGDLGGKLFVEAIEKLSSGSLPRRPQPPGGSRYPKPQPADFILNTAWPARRAFNFMRGTAHWGKPYPVQVDERTLRLKTALAYEASASLPIPFQISGREAQIQFAPGVLKATLV
jgi:methionyl-tRNA formyltransferase